MLQVIETYNSHGEALAVVAYLRANEIDASLADTHTMSVIVGGLASSWYRVLAPRNQAADARRLLGEIVLNTDQPGSA